MGTFKQYQCDKCNKRNELGGPEEFYNTWYGMKRAAGHHGTKKVDGLWIKLWCPVCHKQERKTMIEFSKSSDRLAVWSHRAPIKPEYRHDDPARYFCKQDSVSMLDEIQEGTKCECGGTIEYQGTIKT